jgi:5-methylcytosine-specific restriction protein A
VSKSRKAAWLRDEIILALDLYRREGRNPSGESVTELSRQLRSIPLEKHLADDAHFRNAAAVRLKIANFVALDPNSETQGMSRGSRLDSEVFREFWNDEDRLKSAASGIQAQLEIDGPGWWLKASD